MKCLLVAMALVLASAGCSKYEVYERNLQYMTTETFQAEKIVAGRQLQAAQNALAQAQTSGDKGRVDKAMAEYQDAQAKYKSIEWEERRRSRTW